MITTDKATEAERAQLTEAKTFKARDSATSVLRNLGIVKENYRNFISKNDDGTYTVFVGAAKLSLVPIPIVVVKAAEKNSTRFPSQTVAEVTVLGTPKKRAVLRGVSAVARALILGGATNMETWRVLRKDFNLGEEKRSYPQWYRNELQRKGLLARTEK
jgi:hypothetical protein